MLIFIAIGAFLATILGGVSAFRMKDRLHLILCFSAGAVIGVAFFDLIPEALELAGTVYDTGLITSLMALGFVIYMILDRFVLLHGCDHGESEDHAHRRGNFGAGSFSMHSFLDGVGIGLAFKVSPAVGLIVAFAVLAHGFSDGINTVSMILKNKGDRRKAIKWLVADALAPVLGIASTYFFSVSESSLGLLLALFAGSFLYIGASDLLPESHHAHPVKWTTIMTILGIGFLYLIISLAGI